MIIHRIMLKKIFEKTILLGEKFCWRKNIFEKRSLGKNFVRKEVFCQGKIFHGEKILLEKKFFGKKFVRETFSIGGGNLLGKNCQGKNFEGKFLSEKEIL